MAYLHRFLLPALLLTAGVLAVSCAANADVANPNLVPVEPMPSSVPAENTGATSRVELVSSEPSQSLAPFTQDDVFTAVNNFVETRDAVVMGNVLLSALEGQASTAVLAQVAAERDENQANIDNYSVHARVGYTTYPYVLDAQRVGDQIAALTCLERWGERSTGALQAVFLDQAMIFEIVDGQLHLVEVRTAHDGERSTEGLTCLTAVTGERAVLAARAGVEALEAISADPTLAATTDFASLFSSVAYDTFAPLADTADLSRRRVSPVEVRYTPLGIDPSKGLDFVGVVSVCRYYPDGVIDEIIATGERVQVNAAYSPGTSVEDIVYVHIEPKGRSQGAVDYFWDFQGDVRQGCWS